MAARSPASSPTRRRAPAKPAAAPARRRLAWPTLDQRQRDLLGLALVAAGIFLACVLFLGWEGGRIGDALADGLGVLVGVVRYAVPVVLAAAGALLVGQPVLPVTPRPVRTGTACLFAAFCLMLAGGTLGFGPGPAAGDPWAHDALTARGGALGEGIHTAAVALVSGVGAHILAVFLLLAGLLLVTGATVAGVIQAGRARAAGAGRRVRAGAAAASEARTAVLARRPLPAEPEAGAEDDDAATIVLLAWDDVDLRGEDPSAPGADPEPGWEPEPDPAPDPDAGLDVVSQPWAHEQADSAEPEPEPEPELVALEDPEVPDVEPELDLEHLEDLEPSRRAVRAEDLTPQGRYRASVTEADDFPWQLPTPRVLTRSPRESTRPDHAGQQRVAAQLVEALGHFGVEAKVVGTVAGPHITRYELRLAPGVKVAKVANLKDDLAYELAAETVRILAPIPGKQAVGVEVPNADRRIVHLGDVHSSPPADWSPLTVWLGKDVGGRAVGADLAKMPHLLVAGTTGAGKSACVNAMLSSVLLRATPREVRLVLVDPKQVELNHYESVPHLLTPVITSPRMAANALANLVREMEQRYGMMSLAKTRSLVELNRRRAERGEPALPYILCVIDELADLMMVAPADVEDAIIRLAQKARAVGIHLVLATQSPRVDVITGMIKANVPSRIAFAVSSQTDSRVILDQNGAESLLGQGDMLFSPVGTSRLQRIQGAFIDEAQIAAITDWWRRQGEPDFEERLLEEVESEADDDVATDEDGFDPDEDPLLDDAIVLVAQMGTASTSMLQRRLRLGYTRAGRLIDMLERRGVISGYEGSKPRQVLISEADVPRVVAALSPAPTGPGEPVAEPVGADAGFAAD